MRGAANENAWYSIQDGKEICHHYTPKHSLSPELELLKRCFMTTRINQAWVSDTTFIRTRQGRVYLAMMLDLYSRKVIVWAMSDRNDTQLVCDVLMMAYWR
jgi:putative transposase